MAVGFKAKLEGVEKAIHSLDGLGRTLRNKILRKAVNASARIMLKAARSLAPRGTGLLKKSLGVRIKTYQKSGAVVAIIGPRTGFKKTRQGKTLTAFGKKMKASGQNPTKYVHLIEFGRAEVRVKKKKVLSDGSTIYGTVVKSVPPRPFLRKAFEQTKNAVVETMKQRIAEELEKAAAALGGKR